MPEMAQLFFSGRVECCSSRLTEISVLKPQLCRRDKERAP